MVLEPWTSLLRRNKRLKVCDVATCTVIFVYKPKIYTFYWTLWLATAEIQLTLLLAIFLPTSVVFTVVEPRHVNKTIAVSKNTCTYII